MQWSLTEMPERCESPVEAVLYRHFDWRVAVVWLLVRGRQRVRPLHGLRSGDNTEEVRIVRMFVRDRGIMKCTQLENIGMRMRYVIEQKMIAMQRDLVGSNLSGWTRWVLPVGVDSSSVARWVFGRRQLAMLEHRICRAK